MHCASCNVLRTSCNVQCAGFLVHRTSCRFEVELKCALVFVHCAMCSVQCAVFEIELHFRPSCIVHRAVYFVQCALYFVLCASCIVQNWVKNVNALEYFYKVLVKHCTIGSKC